MQRGKTCQPYLSRSQRWEEGGCDTGWWWWCVRRSLMWERVRGRDKERVGSETWGWKNGSKRVIDKLGDWQDCDSYREGKQANPTMVGTNVGMIVGLVVCGARVGNLVAPDTWWTTANAQRMATNILLLMALILISTNQKMTLVASCRGKIWRYGSKKCRARVHPGIHGRTLQKYTPFFPFHVVTLL